MSQAFQWTDAAVRAALSQPRPSEDTDRPVFSQVSTDTRVLRNGALFVALVGEKFDAHDFVEEAVGAGATGLVVSRPVDVREGVAVYQVRDTLVALGDLARFRRRTLGARVVGVTGSSGKTTTKEFIRAALESTLRTHATTGNLNNRIGLPLTILDAPQNVEALVLEMGTSEPGEIAALAAIAEPDVGVISTVGQAHLEGLGSLEGVFAEKLSLLEALPPEGLAVVGDRPRTLPVRARAKADRVRVAGWSPLADPDLRPQDAQSDEAGRYTFSWKSSRIRMAIPGRHAVQSALLAAAVALELGVPATASASGMASVEPPALRGEVRRIGRLVILADCYNANPQSVRAGLDLLSELPALHRRIAFLGSMLELGGQEEALHAELLEEALRRPLDVIVATGVFAGVASTVKEDAEGRLLVREDPLEAFAALLPHLRGDEIILLKGSRGVALERLIPLLEEAFGEPALNGGGH